MNIARRNSNFLTAMGGLRKSVEAQTPRPFLGHRYFCDPEDGGCGEEWFAGQFPGRQRCFKCEAIVEAK
jgi:hypothetical protein